MNETTLRSSPGPKTGCSQIGPAASGAVTLSCDPHPVRRPGAAPTRRMRTRSSGCCDPHPVRRPGAARPRSRTSRPGPGCDPHPVRRPGAALPTRLPGTGRSRSCDPHPVRRPGAATWPRPPPVCCSPLRSSPGPKTGCSPTRRHRPAPPTRLVAILTRSEDRVQPGQRAVRRRGGDGVAILTRSEDRVQPGRTDGDTQWAALRSSPGPKTGCSVRPAAGAAQAVPVAILTRSEDRVQHRGRVRRPPRHHVVAILTRSEDRVQRRPPGGPAVGCAVAILTRSEDRVQPARRRPATSPRCCCDPHPVRRPGAAGLKVMSRTKFYELRSSPGPKTGCSPTWPRMSSRAQAGGCDPHPVRRPGAASGARARYPPLPRCDPHPVRRPGAAGDQHVVHGLRAEALRSSPGPKTGCSS